MIHISASADIALMHDSKMQHMSNEKSVRVMYNSLFFRRLHILLGIRRRGGTNPKKILDRSLDTKT